jgi:hypothetical protein
MLLLEQRKLMDNHDVPRTRKRTSSPIGGNSPGLRLILLALLLLVAAPLLLFAARPNEAAQPDQIWVSRPVDLLSQPGTALDYLLPSGDGLAPVTLASSAAPEPAGSEVIAIPWTRGDGEPRPLLAFDPDARRLQLLDPATGAFFTAALGGELQPAGQVATVAGARSLALGDDAQMYYLLDASGSRVLRLPATQLASASPEVAVDLSHLDLPSAELLALNPVDGHLYLLSPAAQRLYEITTTGILHASHRLPTHVPGGAHSMVFAPSQDLTGNPAAQSLYVLGETTTYEWWSQNAPLAAVNEDAVLVSMTLTSLFVPPSPDPAGITYWPGTDRLVVSDSEVNEMPLIFVDANIFVVTRDTMAGVRLLTGRSDIRSITREPTDVAFRSGTVFFYSDDDADRIYQVDRTPDSNPEAGDIISILDTKVFGSNDPEGIAYDPSGPTGPRLFVVDGSGKEVYEIRAGAGGVFTDTAVTVTHFDVGGLGVVDPEGIEYDPATGHLLVLDSYVDPDGNAYIYEVTTNGGLVGTINVASAGPVKPAGITLAPSSDNPALTSFYIVDRGVDNNEVPEENDGRLYELRLPVVPPPPPTNTPVTPSPEPTAATVTPTAPPPATATSSPTPSSIPSSTPSPMPSVTPVGTSEPSQPPANGAVFFPLISVSAHDAFGEPNNSCDEAYPLSLNRVQSFRPEDTVDWYRFTTSTAGTVTVRLTGFTPQHGQIAVYYGPTCSQRAFLLNVGDSAQEKTVELGSQPAATYYVYVSNDGAPTTEPYYLEVLFQPSGQ